MHFTPTPIAGLPGYSVRLYRIGGYQEKNDEGK